MRTHLLGWAVAIALTVAILAATGVGGTALADDEVPTTAEYVRIFTGDDGESHFEKVALPLTVDASGAQPLGRSAPFQSAEFAIVSAPGDWAYTWHTAPRRQFVIVIGGTMEVEVAGGTIERFEAGGVLLADDLTGHGHLTRSVGDTPLFLAVVPVPAP